MTYKHQLVSVMWIQLAKTNSLITCYVAILTINPLTLLSQTKQEIRHIRKVTLDKVKELKNAISEDDVRKSTKDVS